MNFSIITLNLTEQLPVVGDWVALSKPEGAANLTKNGSTIILSTNGKHLFSKKDRNSEKDFLRKRSRKKRKAS